MDGRIPAGPGRGRSNRALLGWVWRRYMISFLFLQGCAILMLNIPAGTGNMLLPTAVIIGGFSGLIAAGNLKTAPFLLARPVSRRQVYNVSLLVGLAPWLAVAVTSAGLYGLLVSRVPDHHYFGPPAFLSLGWVVWILALYLCSTCIGIAFIGTVKTAQGPLSGGLAFVWLLVISVWVGIIGWTATLAFHFRTWRTPAAGSAVIITGLALAVTFCLAGWQLFRSLDL